MHHTISRARRATATILGGVIVLACAVVPATSLGQELASADGGSMDLAPIASVPDAPVGAAAQDPQGGASLLPETAQPSAVDPFTGAETGADGEPGDAAPVTGTDAELQAMRARLVAEQGGLQSRLTRLEAAREQAEVRLDAANTAVAARLVVLFEQGEDARLQELIAVRDAGDPELRAELVASLYMAEHALIVELDAATNLVSAAAARAQQVREQLQGVGTRISAIDVALEERRPRTAEEQARTRGDSFSFDADYVFATGPIPGIGYWGAMNGGTMLSGWTGFAGAALGGVGCTAPDPQLRATGSIERGEASWYGPGFNGSPTASGEIYDQTAMTAAHRTLPFGTIVRVYSDQTARCAFVRITDRGPFIDGRVIDLSRAAADAIGMESVAPVQLEVWAADGAAPAADPVAPPAP